MSIRNLDSVFGPRSVALIGASKRRSSVGAVLARNLFCSGFDGAVMPVHPRHEAVQGTLTYPDVASLPMTPDLAVVATPPETVPGIIAELGHRGTKAAVVITAGFGERADRHGKELQQALLDAARPHLLRVVGPNCLGVLVPGIGLNASFSHLSPLEGDLAFVAQSGAMVTAVLDWATPRGIGFSHLVSLGDMPDVDFGDMLDYLALEPKVRAILLYIESITNARKFMSAARAAARTKPVVAVKAGRHKEAARAAASHTGALAGVDAVYDAAFQRAGILRVCDIDELFDAVETLATARRVTGDRLAILTNGGGFGVLATDALIDAGGQLAELSPETIEQLNAVLPATWPRANPVDIIGDAPGSRYADALKVLLDAPGIDAILVINGPTAVASSADAARAVIDAVGGGRRAVLSSWVGEAAAGEARRLLVERGIPTYETPNRAIHGFMHLAAYHRIQELLMEAPPSLPEEFAAPDSAKVRAVIWSALGEGRSWLTEVEAKEVLAAYRIPVVETRAAATPDEAKAIAVEIGLPVALKILSADLLHKSDVGGVALGLGTSDEVREAAESMLERIRVARPDANLKGFAVEPMVRLGRAHELIVGMVDDVHFGPVILFGHGGTAVEVVNDKALALPPLNLKLARDLMSRTRVHKLLGGYRDQPAANLDTVALTLVKVSQLVSDVAEVAELDINPLLADENGVLALDARIRVTQVPKPGSSRLAIRPYPREFEENVSLPHDRRLVLRPVRPGDEPSLQAAFAALSPEEFHLRFFTWKKTLPRPMVARLTQIDYEREMTLVLVDPDAPGAPEALGLVRISADPDNERAEFTVLLQQRMTGLGLGSLLMRRIIDYARSRGIQEVFGRVLRENRPMLKLCHRFGFDERTDVDDPRVVTVTLKLRN